MTKFEHIFLPVTICDNKYTSTNTHTQTYVSFLPHFRDYSNRFIKKLGKYI